MPRFLPIDSFKTLREMREAQDADTLSFLRELDDATDAIGSKGSSECYALLAVFVALYLTDGGYSDAYVRNPYGVSPFDSLMSSLSEALRDVYSEYESSTLASFKGYAQELYLHACYEEQLALGKWESVRTLTERELSHMANDAWFDGRRFSDRLWADKDALYRSLYRTLTRGISTGKGLKEMSEDFMGTYNAGVYVVKRLIRTEFNRVQNQAIIRSYKENGVERYEYVAILDERTSETCEGLNGQTFAVKDAEVGVNMPPMHPNCRSSTIPVWEGKLKVEGDMERLDYESWRSQYVK